MNKNEEKIEQVEIPEFLSIEEQSNKYPYDNRYLQKHDSLFKSLMGNLKVAEDFFKTNLPFAIKQKIDFKSLAFCKETYIDEDLRKNMVDALYKVDFNNSPGYLYLICEHQSSYDKTMAFRMLKYMIRIMDDHIANNKDFKLPIIFPMVFYHGKMQYSGSTDIFDLFGEHKELAQSIFLKPFQLIDVNEIEDSELKKSVLAGTMEFILKHSAKRDILHYLEQITDNFRVIEKTDVDLLTKIIRYVMITGEVEDKKDIIGFIKKTFTEETGNKMATTAELFKQEGRQEGRQEEKKHVVFNMLKKKIPIDDISEVTEVPVADIYSIKEQIEKDEHI